MSRVSMKKGIEAFLGLHWDLDKIEPFRRQRDARDEAMRMVGFAQAQEQLRHILGQCKSATAAELAALPRPDGQLRPVEFGRLGRAWIPPELPVKARRR